MVDPLSPEPLYKQVADAIESRITSGDLRPNQPIPSESAMVQEFGVARETVRRAVAELRNRELVFTIHARGTFVRQRGTRRDDK